MRVIILAALLAACETSARRPAGQPIGPGIDPDTEDSTGAAPRLDLGTDPPIPDLPGETGGTTGDASTGTSTGASETSTGGSSSGSSSSTSGTTSTTGEDSSSGSSSGESSSGEPPAACGDGVCEASERAPCWGPKDTWCFVDCWETPECASDCPCTPGAAAAKNWCYADPPVTCSPTAPGGYCGLPDGDVWGFYSWTAKCG